MFGRDLRVGCDRSSSKSLLLEFSGIDDFVSNRGRAFAFDIVQDFFDIFTRDFEHHIDAVQKRAGNFRLVTLDIHVRTAARFFAVLVISADARIHRCDEHKICGILDSAGDARDDDGFVFQWLTKDFEHLARKLGQLVEE